MKDDKEKKDCPWCKKKRETTEVKKDKLYVVCSWCAWIFSAEEIEDEDEK